MLEGIGRVIGMAVPVEEAPRRPGDPPILVADATRFRETFCANRPERVDAAFVERFRVCRAQTEDFVDHYLAEDRCST